MKKKTVHHTKRNLISLTLFVVVGVFILYGIFSLFSSFTKTHDTSQIGEPKIVVTATPVPHIEKVKLEDAHTPDGVLHNYYNTYYICMKNYYNTIEETHQDSPLLACPVNINGSLTQQVVDNVEQSTDSDQVLCAQNVPMSLSYDNVELQGDHAVGKVYTHWGSSPTDQITVGLDDMDGNWKITSISCSR